MQCPECLFPGRMVAQPFPSGHSHNETVTVERLERQMFRLECRTALLRMCLCTRLDDRLAGAVNHQPPAPNGFLPEASPHTNPFISICHHAPIEPRAHGCRHANAHEAALADAASTQALQWRANGAGTTCLRLARRAAPGVRARKPPEHTRSIASADPPDAKGRRP